MRLSRVKRTSGENIVVGRHSVVKYRTCPLALIILAFWFTFFTDGELIKSARQYVQDIIVVSLGILNEEQNNLKGLSFEKKDIHDYYPTVPETSKSGAPESGIQNQCLRSEIHVFFRQTRLLAVVGSHWYRSCKCVKLAWSLGFYLFRVRRVVRARVRIGVGLGSYPNPHPNPNSRNPQNRIPSCEFQANFTHSDHVRTCTSMCDSVGFGNRCGTDPLCQQLGSPNACKLYICCHIRKKLQKI